jgi:hypothetical protein
MIAELMTKYYPFGLLTSFPYCILYEISATQFQDTVYRSSILRSFFLLRSFLRDCDLS